MARIFICLLIQTLLLSFVPLTAGAQTLYSLKDLCRLANENAEAIKIANEDLYIAEQDKVRARSVLIPRASLYGTYLNYKNDQQSFPDTTTVGGKLSQSFTLNGRELIAYDVSKKGIEKASFSKEAVRSDYIFQVAQAYVQAISLKRLVEVADSDVKRLAAHRDSVKEKLSVGNVTKTALYRAEAELSRAKTDQIVATNDVESSKAGIARLVGIEDDFQVSEDAIGKIEEFDTTPNEIETKALDRRYEIKEAKKAVEIARKTVSYERGDYWPSVSVEGGYNDYDIRYDTSSGARSEYEPSSAYLQAQLQFTLFDGGLRSAQVRQAVARQRQADLALSDQEKKIRLESRDAYLDFVTAKNTWINLQDELKSAKENYTAVQMQFKYGMANSIDIMDANTLLVEAERRLSNAEYAYYLAILRIIYTQGDILEQLL